MAISRNMMERQLRAGGGIMTLEEPRQGYFLGKIVKKAKRAVKKVVKSPLGKIALAATAANFAPMLFGKQTLLQSAGGLPGILSKIRGGEGMLGQLGNIFRVGGKKGADLSLFRVGGGLLGAGAIAAPFLMGGDEEVVDEGVDVTGVQPMVANIRQQARDYYQDPTKSALYFMPPKSAVQSSFYAADGGLADIPREGYSSGNTVMGDIAMSKPSETFKGMGTNIMDILKSLPPSLLEIFMNMKDSDKDDILEKLQLPENLADGGLAGMRENFEKGKLALGEGFKSKELNDMALEMFGKNLKLLSRDELEQLRDEYDIKKGRVEAAEGGLMDLGGMEKDYREGGFVPLGAEARADDVPARLSKNEFVFTADAVRNAGGGDIDKGAEVMQNMMDNLEAGGTISEESQGMENPAQAMFDQAQQLESRIE